MPLQNRQYSSVSISPWRKNRMHTDSQRIIASFRRRPYTLTLSDLGP